jgi:hypothetical protein
MQDYADPLREVNGGSTQRNSVRKRCQRRGRMVTIRRDYSICNSCADAIERGGDY